MHAVVAVLAVGAALAAAKPPPLAAPGPAAAPAPWAAYVGKPGVMGRSLVGLGGLGDDPSAGPAGAALGSPMSPFLKLKPFLPAKPTFMPPVVDPSAFIDMKASLLNSLFPGGLPSAAASPVYGAAPAAYSGLSERALLSPFAAPAAPATKAPPPAFLADLFKALNINKTVANASDATAAAPAYPAYPGAAPVVDPGVFISKKAKFLSDLFAGLAITTPAPLEPATPDPAALDAELAATLQRLLDSLAASTASSAGPQDVPEDEVNAVKAKRAADSAALVADAKDKVVETIIGQLAEIKNDMVDAVSDLALAQKATDAANAAAAAAAAPKKPVSPYASMWAKPAAATTAKPPPPVEPVRQKVVLLGQVFDMLTDMEKDIATSMVVPPTVDSAAAGYPAGASPGLMDMVKAKISQMVANGTATALNSTTPTAPVFTTAPKALRLVDDAAAPGAPASPVTVDPTFWIPDSPLVAPGAYLAKTKEFLANLMAAKSTPSPIVRRSYKPTYYQQSEEPEASPAQQQSQLAAQQQKSNLQVNPGAAIAYQLQQLHHHHHNRQPYWWN